jgi:myo-inositol-1(or 4)-monophosphatase
MSEKFNKRFEFAQELIYKAADLVKDYFSQVGELEVETKGTQDLVSKADRETELYLTDNISKVYPNDSFYAEEFGGSVKDYCWVIDPIDGTNNFLHQIPFFCISIAFFYKKELQFGVILDVNTNDCYKALKGNSAFLNNQKINVSTVDKISDSIIGLGHSYKTDQQKFLEDVNYLTNQKVGIRIFGSAALALCYVAVGKIDGYFERHLSIWDMAAAKIIIEEAGGQTFHPEIDEYFEKGGLFLASNKSLKNQIDFS